MKHRNAIKPIMHVSYQNLQMADWVCKQRTILCKSNQNILISSPCTSNIPVNNPTFTYIANYRWRVFYLSFTVSVLENPEDAAVALNDDVILTCRYKSAVKLTEIVWERAVDLERMMWERVDREGSGSDPADNNTRITNDSTMMIYTSNLTISSVTFEDCGVYRCVAIANFSSLDVISESPSEVPSQSATLSVVGTYVPLSCVWWQS